VGLVVAAAIIVAVAAACGGGGSSADVPASAGSSFHPVAGNFKADDTTLASCKGGFRCLEQAFGNVAYNDGPTTAFKALDRGLKAMPGVEADCHRIVHTIGSASLARNDGDVAKTFSQGQATCNSGYYHGILERAFYGATTERELQDRATSVCRSSAIENVQWLRFSCLHGLGHGLMIQTGYRLPIALHICDGLGDSWDEQSCAGGSFMENFFSTYNVKSQWVKLDDPLYPCDDKLVPQRYKISCYLIVTSHVLTVTHYDWQRTARICAGVEKQYRPICFESYGRDASGYTQHEPKRIVDLCGYARAGRIDCMFGAAREMTSNYANGTRAGQLCALAARPDRTRCYLGIGTIVGSMHTGEAARRAECQRVSGPYVTACIDGANSA
jgi:hypothetical protein